MLGRLVNQAMLGGSGGKDARIVQYWMDAWGIQLPVNIKYPWGNALELVQNADLSLFNLETSITSKVDIV